MLDDGGRQMRVPVERTRTVNHFDELHEELKDSGPDPSRQPRHTLMYQSRRELRVASKPLQKVRHVQARSLSLKSRTPIAQKSVRVAKPQVVGLAHVKMALCPLNDDGDAYFLKTLRDELESLKKRLKHEIIQKLQLIKQIRELKRDKQSHCKD